MPDTVIDRVNIYGRYQQGILVCTDWKFQLIGYGDFELTGVDVDVDKNNFLLKNKIGNYLDYQEDQEEFYTD